MKSGDTLELLTYLVDSVGVNLSYADETAFTAAGYTVSITLDEVAVTPTLAVASLGNGLHSISFTVSDGDYRIVISEPVGETANPSAYTAFIDAYQLADIYASVNSGGNITPITQSLSDQSLGNLIDGDSFATGLITVPTTRLSPFGFTDLSGCTVSAAFKKDVDDTPIVITSSIDDTALRLVSCGFDVFPVAMKLAAGEKTATWYLDIQIIHTATSRKITVARYSLNVLWERDET